MVQIDKLLNTVIQNKINHQTSDAKIYVTDLTMVMINKHLNEVLKKDTFEVLMIPSSICIRYDQRVEPEIDSDISTVLINFEPLELKIGFRELDNFKAIGEVFQKISDEMNQNIVDAQDMTYDTLEDKQNELLVLEEKEQRRKYGTSQRIIDFRARKVKQVVLMNMKLEIRSFLISLLDDTTENEYPIINLIIHNVRLILAQESGLDTPVSYIMKKMSIYKHPVLKADASLDLGANYFNLSNGSYEPLIEPWDLRATVHQKEIGNSKVIKINSEKMLNINLTYAVAISLKKVLDVLDQNSEDWVDEVRFEEIKKNISDQTKSKSRSRIATSMSVTEDEKVNYWQTFRKRCSLHQERSPKLKASSLALN